VSGPAAAPSPTTAPAPLPRLALAALVVVGVKIGLHLVTALITPYEFHRDEFLYFAMGTHLRPFAMDFPPFIAILSEFLRGTVGVSVAAYRLTPAVASLALMLLALAITRRLGGGRRAQVLTALAVLTSPLFLRTGAFFMPVVLDQLWWTLGCYALVRLADDGEPRWWLLLGAAGGLGLLTKFSIGFFAVAVLTALVCTPHRYALRSRWPWLAAALALVLGAPSITGQIILGFPVFGQLGELRDVQLTHVTPGAFAAGQVLMFGPAIVLALLGLGALLTAPALARWRLLGWVAATVMVLFIALRGKPYYVGPIYPLLFAAGGAWLERPGRRRLRAAAAWGIGVLSVAFGIAVLPFGLPIVPPAPMARYAVGAGITTAVTTNVGTTLPLPQDYADMLGWREKAEAVAGVYAALPADEQATAALYGANYGRAGALDLYGRRLGLPPVVSLSGSFYFFGPGERPGPAVILLGVDPEDVNTLACDSVHVVERVRNPWGVDEEQDVPVTLCRGAKRTMQEVWARYVRGEED
jgi:4-amino-4-deoxy-L-arabinose transferase-like glycosyltransferase